MLRSCAARYGIRSVYAAVYTARVDEHVHGCVWTCTRPCTWRVTAVYTAHGRNVPSRPVCTDVYMARTRPFNCGVDVCMCRTAVVRGRIHCRERAVSGPCTRPCTRPVYTVVYWPCIWRVHGRLHGPTRPVRGRVHAPFTAVYTAVYTRIRVHRRYKAVYSPYTRPCTRPVHSCIDGPCTRPVHGSVNVRVHGPCTRPRTRPVVYMAGRPTGPCTRSQTALVHGRVHGPLHGYVRAM